jgi:large subunit ribosomal protein L4
VTVLADAPTRTVDRRSSTGSSLGTIALEPSIFSVNVNVPLIHQVVTAQLASRRSGTQSTLTRAEVSGGGAKPFRQKGTGNARQGSSRSPIHVGGGVALGPKPRKYNQKTPKKMVQQALRCALSDRAAEGAIRVIDRFAFEVPKTKDAIALLAALECEGKVLIVMDREDTTAAKSFANLSYVAMVPKDQLTAYDVLCSDVIVFTDSTLPGGPPVVVDAPAKKAPAKKAAAKSTVIDEPAAEEAAIEESPVEASPPEPVGDEPVGDEPVVDEAVAKPAARKSPAKKAPAKKATAKADADATESAAVVETTDDDKDEA